MKKILFSAITLTLLTVSLNASNINGNNNQKKMNITQIKEKMNHKIDKKIAFLNQKIDKTKEHKTCFNNATNKDEIKSCKTSFKEYREKNRAERIAKRQKNIKKRDQRIAERRAF